MPTQVQQKKALELVNDFIGGAKVAAIRDEIKSNNLNQKGFKKVKLYSENNTSGEGGRSALDSDTLKTPLTKLFCRLNINDETVARQLLQKHKNLYALLKALLKRQHQQHQNTYQLKLFIELINEKKTKKKVSWMRRFKIAFASISIASIIFAIAKPRTYAAIMASIKDAAVHAFRYLLKNITFIQVLAFLGGVLYAFSTIVKAGTILASHTKSGKRKLQALFFNFLDGGLNTTAYYFVFTTAAFSAPISTALFVLASSVYVIKSAYGLYWRRKEHFTQYPNGMPNSDEWREKAAFVRSRNSYQQHRATLSTKIVAGVALIAIVAMWCVFPPSTLVTVGCFVGMFIIVPKLRQVIVKKLKTHFQNKLQNELNDLNEEESLEWKPSPTELLERHDGTAIRPDIEMHVISSSQWPETAAPPPYTPIKSQTVKGSFFSQHQSDVSVEPSAPEKSAGTEYDQPELSAYA